MSSPNLNNSVLLGCTLSYVSVFLFGLDGAFISSGYEIICVVGVFFGLRTVACDYKVAVPAIF